MPLEIIMEVLVTLQKYLVLQRQSEQSINYIVSSLMQNARHYFFEFYLILAFFSKKL